MDARQLWVVKLSREEWNPVRYRLPLDADAFAEPLPQLPNRLAVHQTSFTGTWRVAVVIVDGSVQGLAIVHRFRWVGASQHELEFRRVSEIGAPVTLADIVAELPPGLRVHLDRNSGEAFPPVTSIAFEEALDRLRPGTSDALNQLREEVTQRTFEAGRANIREQRDAIGLGLEIAGLDSQSLISPDLEDPTAFLAQTRGKVSEASVIRHDARELDDWLPMDSDDFDMATFQDPRDSARRVTVIYADKEALERSTGTDLLYYCAHQPGFILVQYKRMSRRRSGADATYYPDVQMDEEIHRFAQLPVAGPPTSAGDWRLSEDAFFVKLVDESVAKPTDRRLVTGYYLPLSLVQLMLADAAVGSRPKGWSQGNLKAYLSNGEFLMLAKQGFIGTRGVTTAELKVIVHDALNLGRSLVAVIDETDALEAIPLRHS